MPKTVCVSSRPAKAKGAPFKTPVELAWSLHPDQGVVNPTGCTSRFGRRRHQFAAAPDDLMDVTMQ